MRTFLRTVDSAKENKCIAAHETNIADLTTIVLYIWCTIHINHALNAGGNFRFYHSLDILQSALFVDHRNAL
mgnify:CR=1 FL=1